MVIAANLEFPRIGPNRELKKALESFWKGATTAADLQKVAAEVRKNNWLAQKNAGIQIIPSNDFSFYDHVLDSIAMLGAVPARYGFSGGNVDLDTYFSMARGNQKNGKDVVAMEMTKWFDTNYHYIVPEFKKGQKFALSSTKAVDEFKEAKALGVETQPKLVGPVTFLLIGKSRDGQNNIDLLDAVLPVYSEVLKQLEAAGAKSVQIAEPALVLDLKDDVRAAYKKAFDTLSKASKLSITLSTYFGDLRDNLDVAVSLPVQTLHIDLVRAPQQLDSVTAKLPKDKNLSIGIVDGRNIWKTDFEKALALGEKAIAALGKDRVIVAPSCPLLHTPVDLDNETKLDAELKSWLAFAKQKLTEVATLAKALGEGRAAVKAELEANKKALDARRSSKRIHNDAVKKRTASITEAMIKRDSPFKARIAKQEAHLKLPLLPTTTIGSFPQTDEIRQARAKFKKGELTEAQYDAFLEQKTKECVAFQDKIGIDVPVHGEFERNDMVEYFGEQLQGFTFSQNGWVQSYGSRCVKPPIIFGDVSRPEPMTVRWSKFAQTLTKRPMKGMLTGPVTILQWSFVRDDQPRETTCKQIALAIRDEVKDLETAGIHIIQIDEPAIREGLPLRNADKKAYLKWAVDSFRISSSGIKDETQIHTHMCYSEFNDIISSIGDMDADVISIETSRSAMELLEAFVDYKYPNQIGPGVYDIHSPRVPKTEEMVHLLNKALEVLTPEQTWVNPDCGLKTRGWKETEESLIRMVEATKAVRSELANQGKKASQA
ncbi:MAG: 5-methyltetrahydropteroyltriglutamate--homocysteine S-methyltransferase [Proteobacteria bacterium]|nr:5-methyltetrahydropteroyltriglutamate--homocysteine S-methyltransferase [Pseudomonadota bacterium]